MRHRVRTLSASSCTLYRRISVLEIDAHVAGGRVVVVLAVGVNVERKPSDPCEQWRQEWLLGPDLRVRGEGER